MKFAFLSTMILASARSAAAFAPRRTAAAAAGHHILSRSSTSSVIPTRRSFTTTKINMANVLKLSEPQSQLLDQVDVFIFDCDGVIWRVRFVFCLVFALKITREREKGKGLFL